MGLRIEGHQVGLEWLGLDDLLVFSGEHFDFLDSDDVLGDYVAEIVLDDFDVDLLWSFVHKSLCLLSVQCGL